MNEDRGNRKDGRFDDDPFDFDDLPIHGIERRKDHNKIGGWRKGHNDHWNNRELILEYKNSCVYDNMKIQKASFYLFFLFNLTHWNGRR